MKVLQLTVHFEPNIGGVETHLLDLVFGLARRKHEVFVLTYMPLVKKAKWKVHEKLEKNITVLRLPWIPGLFYRFVKSPAIEFCYLVPGLFIATPIIILIEKPDVIHAHGLVAGFSGVFWGKFFEIKTIVSTHSIYHFPKQGVYHAFAKWIFSNASGVLCLSNQSVNEIRSLGVSEDRIKRFTYWVDINQFKPLREVSIRRKLKLERKFVVLFVGRLIEEKGIRELLKASIDLPDSVAVLIAGEGPLREEIKSFIEKNTHNIYYIDSIKNKNLPIYYNTADVVIVPSTHEEGFGRVILEALSCGTPVIASNRGAIPEAMNNSVGKLITISPKNIGKAIIELQKHRLELSKLKKNARIFAVNNYSEKNVKDIEYMYVTK